MRSPSWPFGDGYVHILNVEIIIDGFNIVFDAHGPHSKSLLVITGNEKLLFPDEFI